MLAGALNFQQCIMTTYSNPLFTVRSASAPAPAQQQQQPQAVVIEIPREYQPECRISILKLFLCNALAILVVLALAVCAGYFANNRSFSEWDGIVFMTLSVICILYIVACACASCIHYVCVQGRGVQEPV